MKLDFVSGKYRMVVLLAIVGLLLILSSFLIKGVMKLLLFFVFCIVSGAISYMFSLMRMPIDISPVFFLMMIISITYGLPYAIVFLFIASWVPSMLAGVEFGPGAFLFGGSFIVLSILARIFSGYDIIPLGIGLTIANLVAAFFIQFVSDNPGGFIFSIIHAGITIFYFIAFGEFSISVLG